MGIHVFLILCGLSVAFLVYVLAQFWREGHRIRNGLQPAMVFSRLWNPNAVVVTHPISLSDQGGISVMPLQPPILASSGQTDGGSRKGRVLEMPLRCPSGPTNNAQSSKTKVR